jgi:hypothetical protein
MKTHTKKNRAVLLRGAHDQANVGKNNRAGRRANKAQKRKEKKI